MEIKEIRVFKMNLALNESFSISFKTYTQAQNVLVIIETDEGIEGYGEGSPDKSITGDSQEEALSFLRVVAKRLVGKPVDIDLIHENLKTIESNLGFKSQTGKAAIDMACYDIIGKKLEKPVYRILGLAKPNLVPTSLTIGIKTLEETVRSARKYMEAFEKNGLKRIKLKLSGNPEEDIRRVMKLSEVFPGEITLDANQGYKNPEVAVKVFNKLYKSIGSRILFVEEPCPKGDLAMMKYVNDNSPIPVIADESVTSIEDAEKVIRQKSASGINIKLQKSGGIYYASIIAKLAGEKGFKLMVGCNEETHLAISASVNFVAGTPYISSADLDSDILLNLNITNENPVDSFKEGCRVPAEKPGLGVRIADWLKAIINGQIFLAPMA
ncbi:dipeptide epimerase [Candidatus Bathyarchaeota archaeon]|nr:dipeptide epimerase [Candidatus Bathyarchaeota archaeon]